MVQVNKLRAFARIWRNGSLGLAEGFMEKDWETESLATLLTFFADNLNTFEGLAKGGLLQRVKNAWTQKTNRNSRSGSKKISHTIMTWVMISTRYGWMKV